ncbi:hypothetical protein OG321_42290 [Streptomyces sp. NBC_00424]|uniref:hypothetical protein n=1 Tax=unclassified Streptomyces TaxID=2593676 RepID=UPI002253894A|nr:hypothetical protein [Streptomyces sp. NBC_00424]MCX5079028.1 hypothetical protein [Streptomyces sp. NBC_00424]
MDQAPAFTNTHADGRPLTWDDLLPGDLVQVFVGRWPYDTEFADVLESRGRNVVVRFERRYGTRWVPHSRIASILRPVPQ